MPRGGVPASLSTFIRNEIASTFTAAHSTQCDVAGDTAHVIDTLTFQTRGRFSEAEVADLLRSVSEIAHPHGRAHEAASKVVLEDAGTNHGWPSYRAAGVAPTDGPIGLAISWRFTVPHRDTFVPEVENLWIHVIGSPLSVPYPRPEREPITIGRTPLQVGTATTWMRNGDLDPTLVEDILKPRVYESGGGELLTEAEADFVLIVMRALVEQDRAVLDAIGAYESDGDPYRWTENYGRFGQVHLVMPPGAVAQWRVDVSRVDDQPGVSFLCIDMWTREEGPSDLSLELTLRTGASGGDVRGEFINLHVM